MKNDLNESEKPKKAADEELQQDSHLSKAQGSSSMSLLAQVTTLSWNLVIPIVGGVLLGYYLDDKSGIGYRWTLSLLVLGVIIAFSNLYNLYIEHGQQQPDRGDRNKKVAHDQDE